MRYDMPFFFLLLLCLSLKAAQPASLTFYVSPKGSDKANGLAPRPGPAGGPFRTLERARDEIRAWRQDGRLPKGPILVELAPGVYERREPFVLEAQDSGTAEAPVIYRGQPGAEVRIMGGKVVRGWKPVTDPAIVERLAPEARGHVLVVDLQAQGITDYGVPGGGWASGSPLRLELFYNDEPMTIARWPNEGFVRIKDVTAEKPVDVRGTKGSKAPKFYYEGDRPEYWLKKGEKDVWLQGWWFWDWAEERQRIAHIDPEKKLITLEEPPVHPYGYRKGQWFYAYNALCELDRPGEFFLDREKGQLYFWPPDEPSTGKKDSRARGASSASMALHGTAIISLIPTLVMMKQTSYVTFRDMTFEACRGVAVTIEGGTGNRIIACVIRNTGSYAVRLDGGTNNGVIGCDMYYMGDGGVIVNGGDRRTLTPARNLVDNCHIHHYSRWNRIIRPGIWLNGCGNRASHNLIHNAPHIGIIFGGNDHIIEYNEFHSLVYEANDAGVIYGGYDWTMRGHEIRYNFFHHIYGFEGRGCVGVYLDDMFSSAHIYGNIFYQVPRAAFVGGGRDNVIENNIFVDCRPAIHVDARALGWAAGSYDTLVQRLKAVPYTEEPWRTRFPQLLTILEDEPMTPKGNVFARNIRYGGSWDEIEGKARPHVIFIDNLIEEDPRFVHPERLRPPALDLRPTDFALRPDSPAFRLGFKPIPLDKIGLYPNSDRASWPVKHTVRTQEMPKAAAAVRRGPLPILKVARTRRPPAIEGELRPEEWGGAAQAIAIEQGLDGTRVQPPSRAWLLHDGKFLYVAVENLVNKEAPLKIEDRWGANDAVELAFRSMRSSQAPILILRGYPNGVFHSDDEAGAPPDRVRQAAEGVIYRCKIVGPERWIAEWRIPLASLGWDPAKERRFFFNLSVRKTGGPPWVLWQGTRDKCTWQADEAGIIELAQ